MTSAAHTQAATASVVTTDRISYFYYDLNVSNDELNKNAQYLDLGEVKIPFADFTPGDLLSFVRKKWKLPSERPLWIYNVNLVRSPETFKQQCANWHLLRHEHTPIEILESLLEDIYPHGLPAGRLHFIVDSGRNIIEMPLTVEDLAKVEAYRRHLALKLQDPTFQEVSEKTTEANKIKICSLPDGAIDYDVANIDPGKELPDHVQKYWDKLQQPVLLPKKPKTSPAESSDSTTVIRSRLFHAIEDLQALLGSAFLTYFDITDSIECDSEDQVLKLRQLADAFIDIILTWKRKEPGHGKPYTALMKEINLTAPLVDKVSQEHHALRRDAPSCTLLLERGQKLSVAKPRNDFHLQCEAKGIFFGLLHGETDSKGQTEPQAVCKMATMALHSLKIMELGEKTDQVILCPYISESLCTMYLMYYDVETDSYKMVQMSRYCNMFCKDGTSLLLRFACRMFNFFKHVSIPADLWETSLRYVKDGLPVTSNPTNQERSKRKTKHGDGGGNLDDPNKRPKIQNNQPNDMPHERDEGTVTPPRPGNNEVATLNAAYPDMETAPDQHIFRLRSKNGRLLLAKWTTIKSEVDFLEELQTHRPSHVIPLEDIFKFPSGTFLVMPEHIPLIDILTIDCDNSRVQLLKAVAFIHAAGIAHCDLKPSNIVVRLRDSNIFLIDFGSAVDREQRQRGFRGTEGWTAPEVQDGADWDPEKADIFAMARVMQFMVQITQRARAWYQDSFKHTASCLAYDPAERPTAKRLLEEVTEEAQSPARPLKRSLEKNVDWTYSSTQKRRLNELGTPISGS